MAGQTLVLETSSPHPSWALFDRVGDTLESVDLPEGEKISKSLVPSLREKKVSPAEISAILIGVGPGSFTGIRVAVATALGLARGTGAEIRPVRSADAVGYRLPHVSFLGVFTDARRDSFFFTAYERGQRSRTTTVVPCAEFETYLGKCTLAVTTDGLSGVKQTEYPQAGDLYRAWKEWGSEPDLALEPVYLHPAVAGNC